MQEIRFNPAIECRNHQRKATGHFDHLIRTNNPPVFPAYKENKHEAGRTKKLASAQETKRRRAMRKYMAERKSKESGSVKTED